MTTPSAAPFDPSTTLIRASEVLAIIGYKSRDSLDRLRRDDPTFPKAVPLSLSKARNASIAWPLGEIQEWVEKRKNLRSDSGFSSS
jgi:prophage regulatory protein